MASIKEQCQAVQEYIVAVRRKLHEIPETGFHIPKTQAFICSELDKMGIPYTKNTVTKDGLVDSGIVALIEGKHKDKVLALRADMDALPVQEVNDLPYCSKSDGYMHACGHDNHMAMLLGSAKVLNDNKDKLHGSVKLFFQSAEEIITGAKLLIEGGCLENPKVTACFGTHVWPLDPAVYPTGQVAVKKDCMMASGDRFVIHVHGHGCHGSMPHTGVDPIVVASQIVVALQNISSRELVGNAPRVLSICQLHSGSCWNVIPDEAMMEGTIRTQSVETRAFYHKRVEEITKGICEAMRCTCTIEWLDGAPPVWNDAQMTELVVNAGKKILGEDGITQDFEASMATEDFAYYQEQVPGVFVFLNTANNEKNTNIALHNPCFQVDEDVLWRGTALQVQTALDYLSE